MLTTQSRTDIIYLKPKVVEKNIFNEKRILFSSLVSRNITVELVSKERAFPVRCRTKQTQLEGNNFLKWASIAPSSPVLSICLRIDRARPTKILKAITFTPVLANIRF